MEKPRYPLPQRGGKMVKEKCASANCKEHAPVTRQSQLQKHRGMHVARCLATEGGRRTADERKECCKKEARKKRYRAFNWRTCLRRV